MFAATVAGIFEKISSDLIDIEAFWRHAVYSGIFSRIIAKKCRVLHNERLFIAGLMHDIGRLVIAYKLPSESRAILQTMKLEQISLHEAEQAVLGFDHAQVGAELMKTWALPLSHQATARHHHNPDFKQEYSLEVSIVYVANLITELAETGEYDANWLNDVPAEILELTGVSVDGIEDILIEARDQFIDTLCLIRSRSRKASHYAA